MDGEKGDWVVVNGVREQEDGLANHGGTQREWRRSKEGGMLNG